MTEQVLRLLYPPEVRDLPIINQLIRHFDDLAVNILRAQVNSTESWLEIQIVGSAAMIESAIGWLREKGVEVQTLSA
ncbi:MAG: NIL domain-containing protein [Anaerolineae bacterium]|nr:NIL domain-containing protein [Anaerolineae bacterium]